MKDNSITLSEIQILVDNWINDLGVKYYSQLTNTVILMEEVGELARIMSRKYGEQSFKKNEKKLNLEDEMADILWVLVCLANQNKIDLTKAFYKNIEKKTKRDKSRHKNNEKLK